MCLLCQAATLQNAMQCSFSTANPPLNPVTSDERKFVWVRECGNIQLHHFFFFFIIKETKRANLKKLGLSLKLKIKS